MPARSSSDPRLEHLGDRKKKLPNTLFDATWRYTEEDWRQIVADSAFV
jgi:hypothetical protein